MCVKPATLRVCTLLRQLAVGNAELNSEAMGGPFIATLEKPQAPTRNATPDFPKHGAEFGFVEAEALPARLRSDSSLARL